MAELTSPPHRIGARAKLLGAALTVIRAKGFAATTVDDLCAAAGVTKGAFFHHFRSKEDLGVKAAEHWGETTAALFAAAPFHAEAGPVDRILAYLDFRAALVGGKLPAFTCLVGTLIQEVYGTSPPIRDAAFAAIRNHAATLEADFAAALAAPGAPEGLTAEGLALHTQAVIQGAFIIAKGAGDPAQARGSIAHLRRYVALLFGQPAPSAVHPATRGDDRMTTETLTRSDWATAGTSPSARLRTCFVVDGDVEEAARFWVSVVPDSRIEQTYALPQGHTHIVEFSLAGAPYMLFNAPFGAEHTPAASVSILTADQAETDRMWEALGDGGAPLMCGWLKDRYGVHWQVVPEALPRLLNADDKAAAARAMAAMMTMAKIDIAALEAAFAGR